MSSRGADMTLVKSSGNKFVLVSSNRLRVVWILSRQTKKKFGETISEKLVMLEGDLKGVNVIVSKKPVLSAERKKELAERARNLSNFAKKHDSDR